MKLQHSFLLIAALAAAQAAHAQSSVTLYGLLDTGITYVNRVAVTGGGSASQWSMHPGAMQASRWGIRGSEDLGSGNRALFILEGGINVDTGTAAQGGALFGRKSVVGLENRYATVLMGRQSDFFDDIGFITSTVDFGSQVVLVNGLDRTPVQRSNNSVRVNTKPVGGVSFTAMYGFGENTGSTEQGSTRSLGINVQRGALRLMGGYHETVAGTSAADAGYSGIGALPGVTNVTGQVGDVALRTFTLAGQYQLGPARLHAAISRYAQPMAVAGAARSLNSASNSSTKVIDVGVAYAVTPRTIVSASVIHDRVAFVGAANGRITLTNLGIDYFLSKRTDVYANAGYQTTNSMTAPGIESAPGLDRSQALTRVGIRHKF